MVVRSGVAPLSPAEGNRSAYRQQAIVEIMRQREGWIDPAERILLNRIADEVRSQPILDIGVGGGRTSWILRLLSADYTAVDYSAEMVDACRSEYAGLDVRECDARDLSMFGDEMFSLVLFSFNGIDVLDHEGRLRALKEIHRVLRPQGLFLYSTLNKNGREYGQRPWQVSLQQQKKPTRLVKFALIFPSSLPRYWRTYRNWWQRRQYAEDHGSWAVCTASPYEFQLVAHWTLPSTEREVLDSTGFSVEETLSVDGGPVVDDSAAPNYFYELARKVASPPGVD